MNGDAPAGKRKSSRRIVAAKESNVMSFENSARLPAPDDSNVPEEEEGEENETESFEVQRTRSEVFKEKESIRELCKEGLIRQNREWGRIFLQTHPDCASIAENFWNSAWRICAERFYSGNAPLSVALELRDTWLRIIEAEWLDQDQPQMKFSPDVFQTDEPPPPLVTESPSTELFLNSRPLPKKLQDDSSMGGTGEPFASDIMEKMKKKEKSKSGTKKRGKSDKAKVKVKPKSNKKTITTKALDQRKTAGKKKSKGNSKQKKKPVLGMLRKEKPREIQDPNVSEAEETEEQEPLQLSQECTPLMPPPEQPWEVVYLNKQVFLESSNPNLSPTLSEEYRALGVEPWNPAKTGGSTAVFRHANQSSPTIIPTSGITRTSLKQARVEQETTTESEEPNPKSEPEAEKQLEPKDVEGDIRQTSPASVIGIKKGEQLENAGTDNATPAASPVNVLDRMDNLLAADSDHVVDILRPTEARAVPDANGTETTRSSGNTDEDRTEIKAPSKIKPIRKGLVNVSKPLPRKSTEKEHEGSKATRLVPAKQQQSTLTSKAAKGVKEKARNKLPNDSSGKPGSKK